VPNEIIKPKGVDKAWVASDPLAAIVGATTTILSVFHFFSWVGLSADQVMTLSGAVLTLASALRAIHEKKRREKVEEFVRKSVSTEPAE
jgi:hypothetical protein